MKVQVFVRSFAPSSVKFNRRLTVLTNTLRFQVKRSKVKILLPSIPSFSRWLAIGQPR